MTSAVPVPAATPIPVAEPDFNEVALDQACKSAGVAMLRHEKTDELLRKWSDLAVSHLADLGFTTGPAGPVSSGRKVAFGQELSMAQRVKDNLTRRPMSVRVSLFVACDRTYFGRFDAKVSLHCLAVRGPSERSGAHVLVEMPLLSTSPNPELVRFGELSTRLRAFFNQSVASAHPAGLELAMMEFAARVDQALAP